LVVLGLNATLTLALSFSLMKSLRGGKPNGLNYGLYWRRALLAATAARALGDAMHQSLAEERLSAWVEAFAAGTLLPVPCSWDLCCGAAALCRHRLELRHSFATSSASRCRNLGTCAGRQNQKTQQELLTS
jgi:hypothetical protein